VVVSTNFYVIGGSVGDPGHVTYPADIEYLGFPNPSIITTSNHAGTLQTPRQLASLVTVGSAVLLFGGETSSNTIAPPETVGRLNGATIDLLSNFTAPVNNLRTPRFGAGAAVCAGKVYVAGGYTSPGPVAGGILTSIESAPAYVEDGGVGQFSFESAQLPEGRALHSMICINDKVLVLIGGYNGSAVAPLGLSISIPLLSVDGGTDAVQYENYGYTAQSVPAVAVDEANHTVYEFGGFNNALPSAGVMSRPSVEIQVGVYDDDGGFLSWTSSGSLATPRAGAVAGFFQGRLVVFGGYGPPPDAGMGIFSVDQAEYSR
jgi:hypothetical protein